MKTIGIICPETSGHLDAVTTLGRELQRRGHRVNLIATVDAERKATSVGLGFVPIALETRPTGWMARAVRQTNLLRGAEAVAHSLQVFCEEAKDILEDAPKAIQATGIDALIVDQVYPAGQTVADALKLPSVTVCNALPLTAEPGIPPALSQLPFDPSPEGRARNVQAYERIEAMLAPIPQFINRYRKKWGLPPMGVEDRESKLARIAQLPAIFDFPREQLPDVFHHTGPFLDFQSGDSVPFPYEKLDGRPLIFASMGTLQTHLPHVFRAMAAACQGLDAQLVISVGIKDRPVPTDFPGAPLVVPYAPQLELLARASLVLTHAGLNTTLGALSHGVPLVAVPVADEQYGIAARIVYHGVGEAIPVAALTHQRLAGAVRRVLTYEPYRAKARAIRDEIARVRGVSRAADIVEQALTTNRPVLRAS